MLRAEIEIIDIAARKRWSYAADAAVQESWRSHADHVLRGEAWAGDCDDLASTVLDLLARDGVPPQSMWRVMVDSYGGAKIDHQVGMVQDDAGMFLIVGDTFGPTSPAAASRHRIILAHRLDEYFPDGTAMWREGPPWTRA